MLSVKKGKAICIRLTDKANQGCYTSQARRLHVSVNILNMRDQGSFYTYVNKILAFFDHSTSGLDDSQLHTTVHISAGAAELGAQGAHLGTKCLSHK